MTRSTRKKVSTVSIPLAFLLSVATGVGIVKQQVTAGSQQISEIKIEVSDIKQDVASFKNEVHNAQTKIEDREREFRERMIKDVGEIKGDVKSLRVMIEKSLK